MCNAGYGLYPIFGHSSQYLGNGTVRLPGMSNRFQLSWWNCCCYCMDNQCKWLTLAPVQFASVLAQIQSAVSVARSTLGVRQLPVWDHSRRHCRRSAAENHADDEVVLEAKLQLSPTHMYSQTHLQLASWWLELDFFFNWISEKSEGKDTANVVVVPNVPPIYNKN